MLTAAAIVFAAALVAAPPAPRPSPPADVAIRISGPLRVRADESLRTAIVVNHDAVIDGIVENLIVVNGTARVSGTVTGAVTAFNGRVVLEPVSAVSGNVVLYRSTLERSVAARVGGNVVYEVIPTFHQAAWLFWIAMTLVLLAAAAAYVYLARPQLERSAELLRRRPAMTLLAALLVVLGLPVLSFVLVLTGVGVPVGIALMMFVLPVVAFLGYVVTGTTIGQLLVSQAPKLARNPYIAAVLGVLALQLLATVPPVGMLLALLATQVGAGALALYIWRQRHPEPAQ